MQSEVSVNSKRRGNLSQLLQLRVLRLGFLQDGDVGVGVFPEGQKILVSGLGFRGVAGEDISAGKAEMRQRTQRKVDDYAAVVRKLLEQATT
jgi:hypothetical protein